MEKKKYVKPGSKVQEIEIESIIMNSADAGGGSTKDDAKSTPSSSFDMSYPPESTTPEDDTNN